MCFCPGVFAWNFAYSTAETVKITTQYLEQMQIEWLIDVETTKIYIESVVTCPRLLKRWITLDISFQQMVWFVLLTLIYQIQIYLVDSIIQP